jgi:glycosyltransferase involved in cell wall biosynthesis
VPNHIKIEIEKNTHIQAVGFSDKVKYYLSLANLLVFPSHREGFPNVPLQAGAMKCPIIASDIMGNIDIIQDQKTGSLFKAKALGDLTDKISFAIKNPEYMNTMAEANYKRISQNFTRDYVQMEIYKKYLNLLKINRK